MKRETFDLAATIVDRIDNLEKNIFKFQQILNKKHYIIKAFDDDEVQDNSDNVIYLDSSDISYEIFVQDTLENYINLLNLEYNDLKASLEKL